NVPLNDEEVSHRKGSSGTIKSESGFSHSHHPKQPQETKDTVTPQGVKVSTMKVKYVAPAGQGGSGGGQGSSEQTRFPKLEEYAHFHYDQVEIPSLKLAMCSDDANNYKHNTELSEDSRMFLVSVSVGSTRTWIIRRSLDNFDMLDKQLHRCIFDRRFSHLEDLKAAQLETKSRQDVQAVLQNYLSHFSELASGMINCGSVLSWMEMDNRGHRLVATDDSGINTPAIAAAHVIKRYNAQAADEISLQVGDMISVIDMPSAEDTVWWRGKRGFEVGFFPSECVELIGDKVPASMASYCPEPLATAAASRKPCENLVELPPIPISATLPPLPPPPTTPAALTTSNSTSHSNAATPHSASHGSTSHFISHSSANASPSTIHSFTQGSATPSHSAIQGSSPISLTSSHSSTSSSTSHGSAPQSYTASHGSTPSSSTPSPSPSRSSNTSVATASSVGTFSLSAASALSYPDSSPTTWMDITDSESVIRKHGKLLSFLRTFFSHRPPRNQLKQSGIVKERVFGCDLGEHLLNSGHDVPLLLKSCTDIIEEHGIVHGIYRLSGITSNIQKLRLAFDEDRVPDLTEDCYLQDIHSISSLLKMYFRELPNPLLTYQLYDKFAEAVRDEDNKLLKIHDVVQQLPPPHYRTTEYLMRHLARVAAYGHETEMHSKNLAIVWAPNLLRSKELEAGGGAAALQGVGIQAVVTECLICYCDIIFSDKMPNYSSTENGKGQKKPRPKSLAISTPTRLLSLEEARERAFIGHLAPKKFIDVGGGPKNLPSKYHTVIDLPGYKTSTENIVYKPVLSKFSKLGLTLMPSKFQLSPSDEGKKTQSSSKENKPVSGNKKSASMSAGSASTAGSGGWKSIFSKPRSGSVKKARKSSQESVTLGPVQAKAITEEDVHNWKRHLRSAKSAESLFSITNTSRTGSISSRTSQSNTENSSAPTTNNKQEVSPNGKANPVTFHLSHKRSLSSDAPAVLRNRQISQESSRNSECIDDSRQSFHRGDSARKALHRRIPSAPNTPRQDRRPTKERSSSMTRGDTSGSGEDMDISLEDFIYPKRESQGDIDIDAAIKSRLQQVADQSRFAKSNEELTSPLKRGARSPTMGRKKAKGEDESPSHLSPGSPRYMSRKVTSSAGDVPAKVDSSPYDNDDRESRMRHFYSRFHDYAEILSDDDIGLARTPDSQGTMSVSSSGCNMQEVLDQIDTRLAMNAMLFPRPGIGDTSNYRVGDDASVSKETVFSSGIETTTTTTLVNNSQKETEFSVNQPALLSSFKQTEFPAVVHAVPREQVKQLLGLDEPDHAAERTPSDKHLPGTVVGQKKVETNKSSGTIFHKGVSDKSNLGVSATRVVRRRAEFIPSSSATSRDMDNLQDLLNSLENEGVPSSASSKHSSPGVQEKHRSPQNLSYQSSNSGSFESDVSAPDQKGAVRLGMSKCLSVPSDIARSLENVTESQSDMLSSVTISELSMSINSFTNAQEGITPTNGRDALRVDESDPRRRRSTSLDSLTENDHLMTRTLREINRQMDVAFKHDTGSHRMISSDLELSTSPEVKVTPQALADLRSAAIVRVLDKNQEDPSSYSENSNISGSSLKPKKHSLAVSRNAKSYSQSDSEDSLTFVTDVASTNSLANIPLLSPTVETRDNKFSEHYGQTDTGSCQAEIGPDREHSSMHVTETFTEYRQTHRQQDDHITMETRVIQPRLRRQDHGGPKSSSSSSGALTDSQHQFSDLNSHSVQDSSGGRSNIANMCRNRSTSSSSTSSVSSKSSEEFDEVASPDEDAAVVLSATRDSRRDLGQVPLGLTDRRNLGSLSVALPSADAGQYHVVRRQHSPRVDQRSPLNSPRFDLSLSPRSRLLEEANPSDNISWQSNALFAAGAQMDETETERMSSLCAVGIMSQRARLSRESSNSSLQSPESSVQFSSLRSPLATPLREALPDLVQSTTTPLEDEQTVSDMQARSNVPLQLALYHPDEFSMDIPASISTSAPYPITIHPSPSLPQVHTSMDVIMENKMTLKKSNTDNCISEQSSNSFEFFRNGSGDACQILGGNLRSNSFDETLTPKPSEASSLEIYGPDSMVQSLDDDVFERKSDHHSLSRRRPEFDQHPNRTHQPSNWKVNISSEDEVAMEVDNLCNKLVDELKSPRSDSSMTFSPADDTFTVLASKDVRTDIDENGAVSMEVETSLEVHGSEPATPMVRERRLIRSSSIEGGEKVKTRVVSVENCQGEIDQEEVQNVLNQGREMLLSPDSRDGLDRTLDSLTPTSDSSLPGRKTSFSKIPRPKASPDVIHKFSSCNPSYRSSFSGSMSASMHADISPSSSSTSSSSSSKTGHTRRGSEASPVTSVKKGSHARRSSDTKVIDFSSGNVSPTTRNQPTAGTSSKPNPRSRDIKNTPDNKSSRIPLSHRVPSPQSESSSLGIGKPQSKIPSPVPKPRKMSNSLRSQHGGLLADDVIEVTRQSVKRENTGKSEKESVKKEAASSSKKTVTVKDVPEKGAKLVIEQDLKKKVQTVHAKKVNQPSRQVAEALDAENNSCHQSKGTESKENSMPGTITKKLSNDNKTETFEKKTPPPVAKRKFHYDSKSLPRRSKFLESQVSFSQQSTGSPCQYSDIAGSRSSLDDSFLQLAAERHDLFVPEDSEEGMLGLCSGSLRVKPSQKMQSLMDLFERGSDSNMSDSSGSPGTRHRDRTYSGSLIAHSGHLTPCLEAVKHEQEMVEEDTLQRSLQDFCHFSVSSHVSRSRERVVPTVETDVRETDVSVACSDNVVSRTTVKSKSQSATQGPASSPKERPRSSVDLRQRPSSPVRKPCKEKVLSPGSSSSATSSASSPSVAAKNSRPPKYKNNSRTYSESSTSESDTAYHTEGSTVRFASSHISSMSSSFTSSIGSDPFSSQGQQLSGTQPAVIRRRTDPKKDLKAKDSKLLISSQTTNTPAQSPSACTPPTSPRNNERRNSIKELRQVFERCENENSLVTPDVEQLSSETTSPSSLSSSFPSTHQMPTPRARVRSTSPQPEEHRRERVNIMRLSLEIPLSSVGPLTHGADLKSQPLRLGPKPFYGTQK
ncbi:serine-rich adhesin for platelets, partial [Biomphalaria glabrata]